MLFALGQQLVNGAGMFYCLDQMSYKLLHSQRVVGAKIYFFYCDVYRIDNAQAIEGVLFLNLDK